MSKEPVTIPLVNGKIVVYHDKTVGNRGGWRWHSLASNGKIVADSGQAYAFRWSAIMAAKRFAGTRQT